MRINSSELLSAARRQRFPLFLVKAFETLHPGDPPLELAWYLQAMCQALYEVHLGQERRLVRLAVERWGGERIAVGLDARGGRLAVKGWQEETGADVIEVAERLVEFGLRTFIHTDISRDGMLGGPNLAASIELAEKTGAEVIVSGGVGSLQDLAAVREAARAQPGIVGVIVGKAFNNASPY